MLSRVGFPSPKQTVIFNGDYVDRGCWGVEIVALLAAMKLALPRQLVMVRGR